MSKDHKVINSPVLYPLLDESKKNPRVLPHHENLEWLLTHFKAIIRHNRMTRKREVLLPGIGVSPDDPENDALSRIEEIADMNFFPWRFVERSLDIIAVKNAYHPIVQACAANVWDGVPRLTRFIRETITSTNPDFDAHIIRTWMIAAISAAHSVTGFVNHGVLVLQGGQGIGKTEWVRKLDPINCGAIAVGVLLDPKNKDSIIGSSKFWINELGELDATFKKSDIAHLKSHLTNSIDNIRVPFGRRETGLIRRTAYVATVNEQNYLVDTTGNRRWWTVSCIAINYQHDFDMMQVWAEALHEAQQGAKTYLDKENQTQLNEKNAEFERIDPFYEILKSNYEWKSTIRRELTATDVLLELDGRIPSHHDVIRIGRVLTSINGTKPRRSHGVNLHLIPEKIRV